MYAPAFFQTDRAASLAFAAARGFGLVVACDAGRPCASPLPFRLNAAADGGTHVQFHVARGNPLGMLAREGGTWLLIVMGPDAYVSPDWYVSPEQVPTWLYQCVQLSGPVRLLPGETMVPHLESLSETFESRLAPKPIWKLDKVAPARREKLQTAITGIEMIVQNVEGSFKLNQHKGDPDHVSVARALSAQGGEAARAIAEHMVALRPQLNYEPADAAA